MSARFQRSAFGENAPPGAEYLPPAREAAEGRSRLREAGKKGLREICPGPPDPPDCGWKPRSCGHRSGWTGLTPRDGLPALQECAEVSPEARDSSPILHPETPCRRLRPRKSRIC